MYKGAHLTGHRTDPVPTVERLFHRNTFALPLALCCCQGIETLEEVAHQRTYGQQPLPTLIEIDMFVGLEVDMRILLITACIPESGHLRLHISSTRERLHLRHTLALRRGHRIASSHMGRLGSACLRLRSHLLSLHLCPSLYWWQRLF